MQEQLESGHLPHLHQTHNHSVGRPGREPATYGFMGSVPRYFLVLEGINGAPLPNDTTSGSGSRLLRNMTLSWSQHNVASRVVLSAVVPLDPGEAVSTRGIALRK